MSDTNWKAGGEAYLPTIAATEIQFGIPTDLLARVAFEECSWRSGVINGTIKSRVGAVGMFQLMPQFFPTAGFSWAEDAQTAGRYLNGLHNKFQDWQLALAAYNFGPGNIEKYLTGEISHLPFETANYVAQIVGDVSVSGSIMENT
jgi:soluble lytic murein transglycosylase-like protein